MIKILIRLLLLVFVSLTAKADDATLVWNNGDKLSGKLLTADDKTLTWQSPMFADPLQIDLSYLASVKYLSIEPGKADAGDFRILMRNGDFLNGRLTSITDTTMAFESMRFGSFEVARDQVLNLQRTNNSGMIYSGPRGLEQWQVTKKSPNVINGPVFANGFDQEQQDVDSAMEAVDKQIWSETPDGAIGTKKADTAIFLPLNLPDKFEMEFEVQSTKPLNFLTAFGRDVKSSLRIDTWVDVLVAATGTSSFKTLKTVSETDLSVHLYVFVNRTSETMEVYSDAGEKMGEVKTGSLKAATGITFRNGDFDLTIHRLRVSHWDGKTPRIASGNESRIELSDGTIHFGEVQGFDAPAGTLTLLVNEKPLSAAIEKVVSVTLSGQSTGPSFQRPNSWLNWNDGGYISGSLISVETGTAIIKTSYIESPLKCATGGLANIGLSRGTAPSDTPKIAGSNNDDDAVTGGVNAEKIPEHDHLFHKDGSLRGTLVVEGAAETPIQWTPAGGLNASALQSVENARFVRAADVKHHSEDPAVLAAYPDVIYLKNHDVLPCLISVITEDKVDFASPMTEVRSFAKHQIQAVELSTAGRIHQSGFADEGWSGLPRNKKNTDHSKLICGGNARYSHPEILTGDTVRFHLEWPKQSWASVDVDMFGNGTREDEHCTHVCFNLMPNQLQVMDKPLPVNQRMMGMRMGGGMPGAANGGPVTVLNSEADIQLLIHDGTIIVSVNGQPARTIKINPISSGGRGISFVANLTAVGQVVANGGVKQRADNGVTISKFEVDNLSGASIRQFIEEESRQAVLTIPRFRRDSPPTHVIIAPNGDLLRGRLLSVAGDTIEFESRLETLRFDRSRVGAIVWLDPPKKEERKADDSLETPENPAGTPSADPPVAETVTATDVRQKNDTEGFAADSEGDAVLQARLADGFNITMKPLRLVSGRIEGSSALLGKCSFPANSIRELLTGDLNASLRLLAYDSWVTKMAREPDWDIPKSDGGSSEASALIGKSAPDFELPMLDGTTFKLSDHKDKIVVLDFWATWCGPCVMALPDYIAATSKFDEAKVMFVAVNLQESPDQIRTFLSDRKLSPRVALDRSSSVAPQFQVSGIPHTVIIGHDNIVEDVHVGYQPGSGETLQTTIQQMLEGTWKRSADTAAKQ